MSFSEAHHTLKRWREHPVAFVRECLNIEPDPWQVDVLEAFPKNQRLAMKACKGPGKTAMLSWLCWNFLATRPHPKIAATSISGDNLADGLWAEMAKTMSKSEFLKSSFTWTKTRIFANDHAETWWMSARTWAKASNSQQQANTLAGIHADYMMFVLDESGGIPDAVMAAAEAGLANDMGQEGKEAKLIQAGNPTHLDGPLYRACTNERHLWWVIEVTSDPDDPKRTPRVSAKWAREQIDKYGKDNPWVLVNVFGKFPPGSINSILGPDEVMEAMKRTIPHDSYQSSQKRLGIDVARFGDDRTIIFPRQGLASFLPVELRLADTVKIAERVMLSVSRWSPEMLFIDDTGHWGHGVYDNLKNWGVNSTPIQFHGRPVDDRYKNRRAEMWLQMAEWVRRGGSLPNIPELVGELTTPTYTFANGKFQLEDKDQIKSRLGRSPDLADALALTFAIPEMPAASLSSFQGKTSNSLVHDWNPFDSSR